MTMRRLTWFVPLLMMAVGALGCESTTHEASKQRAEDRYREMRGRMMLPLAQDQFAAGDLDQAERTVNEALRIDPKAAPFYVVAGQIAVERGRLEYGLRTFDQAIELGPKYAPAHYQKGMVLQRWQQYDLAQQSYQTAYDLEPDRPSYLLAVAEMLDKQDRRADAMVLLESRLTYFTHNAGLRMALGQFHAGNGDGAKAAEYYREAMLLAPNDQRIVEELALAELASGQAEQAIPRLERLLAADAYENRSDLRSVLGAAYIQVGRNADARSIFLRLTREDPENRSAWSQLGKVAWAEGDTAGALRAAGKIIALSPQSHEGYLLAGMVWQRRGRLDQALPMLEKAAAYAPHDQTVLLMRGLSLQEAGDRQGAAQVYRQALELKPDDARIQRLLAQVDTE